MTWQRLSQRTSGVKADGPYEGVPTHLVHGIVYWFQGIAGYRDPRGMKGDFLRQLAVILRVSVPINWEPSDVMLGLVKRAEDDQEFCLDLVDASLNVWGRYSNDHQSIKKLLAAGASVWTVGDDSISLTRIVGEEAHESFNKAVAPMDKAAEELRTAWSNSYGRNGDPSDAWDHAIKALEHLLIPVVVPNKQKATLSDVVGTLRRNDGNKWRCSLPGKDENHEVSPLVGTLDLIWPNTVDRHGGGAANRAPSEAEARSVVSLAVALVQAHREEPIVYKI